VFMVKILAAVITVGLALAASSQATEPTIEQAQALASSGDTKGAIEAFRAMVEANPKDGAAHNALGSLLNSSGHYAEALEHVEAAVALEPKNAKFRYNRGVVLAEHGRFAEAIRDFNLAIAEHPDLTYAWLERGAAKLSLGNAAGARDDWRKARESDPKLVWVEWYEATDDFVEGRFAEAAKGFDRVGDAEPGFVPAQLWRIIAHARAGRPIANPIPSGSDWPAPVLEYRLGRISQDQLISLAKQDKDSGDRRREAEALYFLGQFELIAGRPAAAAGFFERALAIPSPRHVWRMSAERELAKIRGR